VTAKHLLHRPMAAICELGLLVLLNVAMIHSLSFMMLLSRVSRPHCRLMSPF